MQFLLQNVQIKIFKILEMFKYNIKFTRAACWINSKEKERKKYHTHDILIFSLLLVIIMVYILKVVNASKLHFLKSLKLNCSNAVCSLFMRLILKI